MGILEEVNASYEKLSPVQKRIADFIFKYPDQVCFYSLKELSETLGVTEVTILRFTKKIGAQSFVEMKSRLREHLQTRLVHGDGLNRIADHVGGIRFGDHDKEEMFQEFVANEKNVIAKTFEQVSLKDILSAVAIIRQSRKIYVVGSELVTGLCAYTTRRLLTLGLETLDLSNLSRALYNNYLGPRHTGGLRDHLFRTRIRETYREYRQGISIRRRFRRSPSRIRGLHRSRPTERPFLPAITTTCSFIIP